MAYNAWKHPRGVFAAFHYCKKISLTAETSGACKCETALIGHPCSRCRKETSSGEGAASSESHPNELKRRLGLPKYIHPQPLASIQRHLHHKYLDFRRYSTRNKAPVFKRDFGRRNKDEGNVSTHSPISMQIQNHHFVFLILFLINFKIMNQFNQKLPK